MVTKPRSEKRPRLPRTLKSGKASGTLDFNPSEFYCIHASHVAYFHFLENRTLFIPFFVLGIRVYYWRIICCYVINGSMHRGRVNQGWNLKKLTNLLVHIQSKFYTPNLVGYIQSKIMKNKCDVIVMIPKIDT